MNEPKRRDETGGLQSHIEQRVEEMGRKTFGAFSLPWPRKPVGGPPKGAAGKGGMTGNLGASRGARNAGRGRGKRGPFGGQW